MKRREFLGAAVTFAAGAAAGSGAAHAARLGSISGPDPTAILVDRLLEAFPDRQSLALIGDAFWRNEEIRGRIGRSPLPDTLSSFLRHIDLSAAELHHMKPDEVRRCIKTENARDFSKTRIIRVQGWLLGETEARLCALAALRPA